MSEHIFPDVMRCERSVIDLLYELFALSQLLFTKSRKKSSYFFIFLQIHINFNIIIYV
jgi:hypothetical protein